MRSTTDPAAEHLPALARGAADRRRPRKTDPIKWSAALAEAPWQPRHFPAAWELAFRRAYAERLVERSIALPAKLPGRSGGKGGKTLLASRKVYATPAEFADQDRRAEAAGLSWSTYARRRLAE